MTDTNKIEALRFALAKWDADVAGKFICTNVAMGLIKDQNDCEDCKATFLDAVRAILDDVPAFDAPLERSVVE